ncbi:MAG: Fic family protein [Calditrichaeota bacterium]|nr:MAG: Fic family protein [Calditrichota bacterium]
MQNLILDSFLKTYKQKFTSKIETDFPKLKLGNERLDLDYQTQVSAVFSSNIEGNSIDLNSYFNLKLAEEKFKPKKDFQEIEDLVSAYGFVQKNELNEKNFLESHKILSKNILIKSKRGNYRNEKMGVFSEQGLVYLALEPEFVPETMKRFFEEITELLHSNLGLVETFYYASFIHLKFVHIHPFSDGNGRSARLLEKWFLASVLDKNLWKLASEKFYKENRQLYYQNIDLGVNYYEVDYKNCFPFLEMLVNSIS